MKPSKLAGIVAALGLSAALVAPAANAAVEQFFPVLAYRTGAYAPNGAPWANGFVDYLKLTNARGGVNGVKMSLGRVRNRLRHRPRRRVL